MKEWLKMCFIPERPQQETSSPLNLREHKLIQSYKAEHGPVKVGKHPQNIPYNYGACKKGYTKLYNSF